MMRNQPIRVDYVRYGGQYTDSFPSIKSALEWIQFHEDYGEIFAESIFDQSGQVMTRKEISEALVNMDHSEMTEAEDEDSTLEHVLIPKHLNQEQVEELRRKWTEHWVGLGHVMAILDEDGNLIDIETDKP